MPRRSTRVALGLALLVLTVVVALLTRRLQHQASLSTTIRVDWFGWGTAVVGVYAGLGLMVWWAVSRDRRRARGR